MAPLPPELGGNEVPLLSRPSPGSPGGCAKAGAVTQLPPEVPTSAVLEGAGERTLKSCSYLLLGPEA